MHDGDILILKGHEVLSVLSGREQEVLDIVKRAYIAHGEGHSSLPHSLFLHFPDNRRNRIIALPAFLGDGFDAAGVKWVASFPGNHDRGLDRASAVLILSSPETGRPQAITEGAVISAKRTAASAALAASYLHRGKQSAPTGFLGCGLINFEIARFLLAAIPEISSFMLYDLDRARAELFKGKCEEAFGSIRVSVADSVEAMLAECPLVSFATTAGTPHISDLSMCPPGSTILHISLRDLAPEVILKADNVVDDVDHVCRAQTSLHLAEQSVGNRDFIRCPISDVLSGAAPPRREEGGLTIFSPFGLGVLDIAVGKFACEQAAREGMGIVVDSFLPAPWADAGGH
jgi:2,3-diaminopropionate biosynthesis protein SbnB